MVLFPVFDQSFPGDFLYYGKQRGALDLLAVLVEIDYEILDECLALLVPVELCRVVGSIQIPPFSRAVRSAYLTHMEEYDVMSILIFPDFIRPFPKGSAESTSRGHRDMTGNALSCKANLRVCQVTP